MGRITIRGYSDLSSIDNSVLVAQGDDMSVDDGFHSMDELYEHRLALNAGFFNALAKEGKIHVVKSRVHSDGEPCFGGDYFIVVAELPSGQVSYHYLNKEWDMFKCSEAIPRPYDGHTAQDVVSRITKYIKDDLEAF